MFLADRRLLAILALALVLRLGVAAGSASVAPVGDAADYDRHAAALVALGTYPPSVLAEPGGASALRAPAYPYLLAGAYELTGGRWAAGRLLGVALGVLTVGLLFLLARDLWGRRAALWTAGIAAVFPPFVNLPSALLAEVLFIPVVLGALLAVLRLGRTSALRWAAVAGALCGLAVLTRTNGAVLLVALIPAAWLALRGHASSRRALSAGAVVLAAAALVVAPWAVRNQAAFGSAPMGTQTGYALAGMFNADAAAPDGFHAVWRRPETVPATATDFRRTGVDEADLDRRLRSRALAYAVDHPGYLASVVGLGALRLFDLGPGHTAVSDSSYSELGLPGERRAQVRLGLYIVLALAVVGAVGLTRRRAWGPWWIWAAGVLLALSVLPTSGAPRYRLAVDPFLILLGGVGVASWRERRAAAAPAGAVASQPAAADLGAAVAAILARVPRPVIGLGFLVLGSIVVRSGSQAAFWIDEGLSVGIASQPLGSLRDVLLQDGAPPLYYALLGGWTAAFGTSMTTVHALSLLAAVACVPVAWWAAREPFGVRAAWIAAVIAALGPFLTRYSQEGRMYALVALGSVVLAGALVRVLERPGRGPVALLAVTLTALLYTHNWALFVAVGTAAAVLVAVIRAPDRRVLALRGGLALAASAALYAPWLPTVAEQVRHTGAPWSVAPTSDAVNTVIQSLFGASLFSPLLFVLAAGLLVVCRQESAERRAVLALVVLLAVTFGLALASAYVSPGWAMRYFAVGIGPALLLAGAGLSRAGGLGLAALALAALPWLAPGDRDVNAKSNVATVVAIAAPQLRPGDLVVATQPEQTAVLRYLLPDGLRYATTVGAENQPEVMDWRDVVERLERSPVDAVVGARIRRLAPGRRVLVVRPISDFDPRFPRYIRLIAERSVKLDALLARDRSVRRLAAFSDGANGDQLSTVRATLYERRGR